MKMASTAVRMVEGLGTGKIEDSEGLRTVIANKKKPAQGHVQGTHGITWAGPR